MPNSPSQPDLLTGPPEAQQQLLRRQRPAEPRGPRPPLSAQRHRTRKIHSLHHPTNPHEYLTLAEENSLTPQHFYHPAHRTLFEILLQYSDTNAPIEIVSLTQTLLDRNQLDIIGGPGALAEISSYSPTAAHFEHHINIVKDKYTLRSLIESCTEAITRSYEDQEDVAPLLDEVEQKILAIRELADTNQAETTQSLVSSVIVDFEKHLHSQGEPAGITTGYSKLDGMSNGLKPGEMFIIAARPSMGKTSFVMNLIEHICLDLNEAAMVFSCEMTSQQIVQRLLFARARYALGNLRNGIKPSQADIKKIKHAANEVKHSQLFIDDTAGITISELRAKARRKKRENDIKVIAVDYLQLMRSTSKQAQNSREREIAEISAGLKALAKELSIPILVLAQLNRGPENRGGTPRMSDLRESGSIEQDADMVGLLYRSAYYAEDEEQRQEQDGIAALLLAKNRNGPTGEIPLTFIKEVMRFETRAVQHEPG